MTDVNEIKTEQQAVAAIRLLVAQAEDALDKAARLASEYDVEFSFNGPSGSYGMGGWFSSNEWQASSHSC